MSKLAKALTASAGNAGEAKVYVEDVFSTFLWEGNATARSINNGLDLSGEGGLVWIKNREVAFSHTLSDTEQGANKQLNCNIAGTQGSQTTILTAFNNNGFTIGTDSDVNQSAKDIVSWSFKKTEKFFDCVKYTGNSVNGRAVAHNLGSVPAMIIIKNLDVDNKWYVWIKGFANDDFLYLNDDFEKNRGGAYAYLTANPTSTTVTVGSDGSVNQNTKEYIMYLFGDEAAFGDAGDESIVKVGTYTGNNGSQEIELGFEPQFVMVKNLSVVAEWCIFDNMRGFIVSPANSGDSTALSPNTNAAEVANTRIHPSATGFGFSSEPHPRANQNGNTYMYMAIRRGPMKTPSAGTEVFTMDTQGSTGDGKTPGARSPWAVDFAWWRGMDGTDPTSGNDMATRLNVPKTVASQFEFVEGTNNALGLDFSNGFTSYTTTDVKRYAWMFRRGTAFCDVVSYLGYGGNGLFYHNLTVIPEMVWIKSLNVAGGWQVGLDFAATQYRYLPLNDDNAYGIRNYNAGYGDYSGAPTATRVNTSGSINDSGTQYVAYLWATLAGVSKVGSYTGTGSDINVDCGFSAGARFILIRRTDSAGNWVYYDYLRGITVNNNPGINMNDILAPVVANYVKPLNAGFIVTSSASADLNANGGTYLFLALS